MGTITRASALLAALLSLPACTAQTGGAPSQQGDPASTTDGPVGEAASALGGGLPRTSSCVGWPCTYELSWYGDHAHYVFLGTGDNHVIVGNLNGGRWGQQNNASGTFDAFGLDRGSLSYFSSQFNGGGCTSGGCAWSSWSANQHLYIADVGTRWMDTDTGIDQVTRQHEDPNGAWNGGFESFAGGTRNLKVCSVNFVDGQHVGRWFDGFCHIGWGNTEQALTGSMVLEAVDADVDWLWNNNDWKANAIAGGWQGGPQYICRFWTPPFQGLQPGKVVGNACSIGWGNSERWATTFQVLSRNAR